MCVYICMYICIYVHSYIYIYVCTYLYMYTCISRDTRLAAFVTGGSEIIDRPATVRDNLLGPS